MSLLSMIQDVAQDPGVGIASPSTVISNTQREIVELLSLAQKEGEELSRRHDWQNLVVEYTFTSVAQIAQTNGLSATTDYDRLVYNAELWDRTLNQKFSGPTQPREWQILRQGITGGVTGWWRLLGDEINIYPAPVAGSTFATEYVSKNWCKNAAGTTTRARWADDTDLGKIPERLMALGVIWRWRKAKGLDYAEEMATYEREVEKACSRDRGTGLIRKDRNFDYPPAPGWDQHIDA